MHLFCCITITISCILYIILIDIILINLYNLFSTKIQKYSHSTLYNKGIIHHKQFILEIFLRL